MTKTKLSYDEENALIGLPHEEVPHEAVRYLPEHRVKADTAFHTSVAKLGRHGLVDAIGHGKWSGARLYRLRYDEGDFEHVTFDFVTNLLFPGRRLHDVFPSR